MWKIGITLLASLPAPAMAGGLVWSDRPSGVRSIQASGFDGSNRRTLYSGAGDPRGVIIDAAGGRVYFTDRFGGSAASGEINSVPLEGGARAVHLAGLNRPADMRFDPGPRLLYWCEESGGVIRRSTLPVSGGALTAQVLFAGLSNPYYLDFDQARNRLFWSTSSSHLISGPLEGGSPDPPLYASGQNMRGVCVDSEQGMIYWVERDGDRAIRRRAIDGGPIETLYAGLDTPHGLVLDLPARFMYWVDTGSQNAGGFNPRGVSRGNMDGSQNGAPEIVVPGTSTAQPWDIDLDPRVANYTEWKSRFFRFDASSDLTDPQADPDADGLNSFGEYAFGQPPLAAITEPLLQSTLVAEGDEIYPAVIHNERVGSTDVDYAVFTASDLDMWSAEESATVVVARTAPDAQGLQRVTVRSTLPLSDSPQQFFRVRASRISGS